MCICSNSWLHLLLDKPRIISNIAAISRLTTGLNISLHICGPLIFEKNDKTKWRANLDYIKNSCIHFHQNVSRCLHVLEKDPWIIETGSLKTIWDPSIKFGDVILFGPENGTISEDILKQYVNRKLSLPQPGLIRSLNLSQCTAVTVFEIIRKIYKINACK